MYVLKQYGIQSWLITAFWKFHISNTTSMQVDRLVGKDHLFKRSIILIKAWCYYESRILGAHHGLISTYALETLVLYIFHLYHSNLNAPLAVSTLTNQNWIAYQMHIFYWVLNCVCSFFISFFQIGSLQIFRLLQQVWLGKLLYQFKWTSL